MDLQKNKIKSKLRDQRLNDFAEVLLEVLKVE